MLVLDLWASAEGVAFVGLVLLFCLRAEAFGGRLGVLDLPDDRRKLHRRPTPLIGGIAVVVPLVLLLLSEALRQPALGLPYGFLALLASAFLTLGHFDDRSHVPVAARLLFSSLLLGAALVAEPGFVVRELRFGAGTTLPLGALAEPFTLICLLGFINAVNMADGANGLVIGLSLGWGVLLLPYVSPELALPAVALIGGLVIVLPFNLRGRLFLGDAGSYTISALIGLFAIHTYGAAPVLAAERVMLWFLLPILDCLRLILLRAGRGRSPFSADREHLHHKLLASLPAPVAIGCYLTLALAPGALAQLVPAATMPLAALMLLGYAGALRATSGAALRRAAGIGGGD